MLYYVSLTTISGVGMEHEDLIIFNLFIMYAIGINVPLISEKEYLSVLENVDLFSYDIRREFYE